MKRSPGVLAILLPVPNPQQRGNSGTFTPPLVAGDRVPPVLLTSLTATNQTLPFALDTNGQLILHATDPSGNYWARFTTSVDWDSVLPLVPSATLLLPFTPRQVGAYWYQYPRIDTLHLPYFTMPKAIWQEALHALSYPLMLHIDGNTGTVVAAITGAWLSDTDIHNLVRSLPDWPARHRQPFVHHQSSTL